MISLSYSPFWFSASSLDHSPFELLADEQPRKRPCKQLCLIGAGVEPIPCDRRSAEKLPFEIVGPLVALIVENFRAQVVGLLKSNAWFQVGLERGNLRMRGQIIGRLKNPLSPA